MRPQKTKSLPPKPSGTASTYREAEAVTGIPADWVKLACESGGARTPGGRIDLAKAAEWVQANAEALEKTADTLPLREQKLAEEVRKLRLRNDRDAGKLVELAWVNERFQRLAGEVNGIRTKSEQEDAMRFAEALGDVAKCRTVLRGIWDDILANIQSCAKHFEQ